VNRALANFGKATLFSAGHYHRALRRTRFPGVAVLGYHGLRADDWPDGAMALETMHLRASTFEAHCRFVRETCHPISLDQWRQARAGTWRLPERPVLFTFDDGYRSVLTIAAPILAKYQLPAVVFCCSVPNEERRLLWWDYVAARDGEAGVERWKDHAYDDWLASCALPAPVASDADPRATLTPAEIGEISRQPGIEIGAHTARHPILSRAPAARQRDEIADNQEALGRWTGRPVRALAYPNGRPRLDYDTATLDIVRDLNFDFAFTIHDGFSMAGDPPLEYPRFLMLAGLTIRQLAHQLAYTWHR
jgi:peptidoglycan/xylan/chitin deacetylase (PgdA/CDA1 family)